jgi:hypothetical protein
VVILAVAISNFVVLFPATRTAVSEGVAPGGWVPLITYAIIVVVVVSLSGLLAYLLATDRRRKLALGIAMLGCIGFPVGTVLGALTIYALTRHEVKAQFGETI